MKKYSASGNDFFFFDRRGKEHLPIDLDEIRFISHRQHPQGGSDGVVFVENTTSADARMRIFNADGSEANACGNALRCLPFFLSDLGLIQSSYRIRMGDFISSIRFENNQSFVCLGEPKDIRLNILGGHFVNTGVPHFILFVPDVDLIDLEKLAPSFRFHPIFDSEGTNVSVVSQGAASNQLRARTFERGVERETLACGTAAAAIASIWMKLQGNDAPLRVLFSGGMLQVFKQDEELWLVSRL